MNLWGTLKDWWSIGRTASSPMLKNNSGVLEVKRTDDAAFSTLRCADATGDDDVINKRVVSEMLSVLEEAIGDIESTTDNIWCHERQTQIDVSSTTLKVLPPKIFDESNGDTLPPLRPDGSYGFSATAPYIDFAVLAATIAGGAAVAPWETAAPVVGGETLMMLQRKSDGSYQLKKGNERVNSTIVTWVTTGAVGTGAATSIIVIGQRKTNVSGQTLYVTGINRVLLSSSGNTYKFRLLILNYTGSTPVAADIIATGEWSSTYGGVDQLCNASITPFAVANGASVRFAVEMQRLTGSNNIDIKTMDGTSRQTLTDASQWTRNTGDATYRVPLSNFASIASLSAGYELGGDITFVANIDATLVRPTLDAGAQAVCYLGTPTYPVKRPATTTLLLKKYSEVVSDSFASNPTSAQCPVCMLPPPQVGSL